MKGLYLFLFCVCFFSCKNDSIVKPDFLIGKWKRLNNKSNKKTYEIWRSNFTGIGFTLQESDTIFKEILSVIEKNDSLFLQVVGVNEKPTLFKFTKQSPTSFTCENPDNEFPKKIQYQIASDTLRAEVSNDDFSIDFVFVKSAGP